MRLSEFERNGLKKALEGFQGNAYIFGSRLNDRSRGGDIDILIMPDHADGIKHESKISWKFVTECEQTLDILTWKANDPFCEHILKQAVLIYDHGTYKAL